MRSAERQRPQAARDIQREVCAEFGIAMADLVGKSRRKPLPDARTVAMRRIRKELALKLTAIGALFDRDHTTVIYHLRHRDYRER